jgi:aspartate racemase
MRKVLYVLAIMFCFSSLQYAASIDAIGIDAISKKKIGIIGGAGPAASCQLYKEMIAICQSKYGCVYNKDFPEIILISCPFDDMCTLEDRQKNQKNLEAKLKYCFEQFKRINVPVVGIACNTLHTIVRDMPIDVPQFVPIMDATLNYAEQAGMKRLLILGSKTTLTLNLYNSDKIQCIVPAMEDRTTINNVIDNIFAAKILEEDSATLNAIIRKIYQKQPFDGVVLGCTELPLLHQQHPLSIKDAEKPIVVLDTLKILAQELCRQAMEASSIH